MRTTVRLDEELLARVKEFAARHNRTMTSVLEDALRQLLDRYEAVPAAHRIDLITFHGDGLQAEIDISDGDTWKRILDDEDAEHFLRVTHENA